MFPSKDGKKFGSAYVAKRRDAEHDKMGAPASESEGEGLMKKATPAPAPVAPMPGEEQKPAGMAAPPEDPKQVVAAMAKQRQSM